MVRVNAVSGQVNRNGSLQGGGGRQSELKGHSIWQLLCGPDFTRNAVIGSTLRMVMCKQDSCWCEQSLARTDIKQRGVALPHYVECFQAGRIIKEKPGRGRKERKTE